MSDHEQLSATLTLRLGAIEVGLIEVSGGYVTHAELPGVTGDSALAMLARMANLRVTAEPGRPRIATVTRAWRDLFDEQELVASPARTERLAAARAELQELSSGAVPAPNPGELPAPPSPLALAAADLLDWAAIQAYLASDFARARALMAQREQLVPGGVISTANLERLRLRLLEDELVATVSEAAE